jgi:hypothetical protein
VLALQISCFHTLNASTDRDFDAVFATLDQPPAGALVIGPGFLSRGEQLSVRLMLPSSGKSAIRVQASTGVLP